MLPLLNQLQVNPKYEVKVIHEENHTTIIATRKKVDDVEVIPSQTVRGMFPVACDCDEALA